MRYLFLLLMIFVASCTTVYDLKKARKNKSFFQNSKNLKKTPDRSTKKNTKLKGSVIADLKSEITTINTKLEQLNEKLNDLQHLLLDLKNRNLTKPKVQTKINKEAKKTIKKINKAKKRKLSHFAKAQSNFKNKKWELAIESYERYRKSNPKGKNYAKATKNIALSLEKLGFKEEAKSFYNELKDINKKKRKKTSSKKRKNI